MGRDAVETIGWRLVHVSECKMRLTNWATGWPTWQVFWTMIHRDLHYAGEIGALRDLYRAKT
jgi:hypothetical protein